MPRLADSKKKMTATFPAWMALEEELLSRGMEQLRVAKKRAKLRAWPEKVELAERREPDVPHAERNQLVSSRVHRELGGRIRS